MKFLLTALLLAPLFCHSERSPQNTVSIYSNFPGGNVTVDSTKNNHIYFRPDLRDTGQDWFYWYFAAKPTKSDTLYFNLTRINCLTSRGPAVSTDGGLSWKWLEKGYTENSFSFFAEAGQEVRFSMGMPYTQANFDRFIKPYRSHKALTLDTLNTTAKGRQIEKLIIGSSRSPKQRVIITARHHSCEMMANYTLEGVISTLLSDDRAMKRLRKTTEFWIIPFVDKDGVEDGDQGKARIPRDHNRDYDDKSIYASSKAIKTSVMNWYPNTPLNVLDLHCPWIKGGFNEHLYIVGNASEKIFEEQKAFARCLSKNNKGIVKFDAEKGILPFGTSWNTSKNYTQGTPFTAWASQFPTTRLSNSFEIPYAKNYDQDLTAENLRGLGVDLAHSMAEYFEK